VGQGGRLRQGQPGEIATQTEIFTRFGTERIIRYAFDRAQKRAAERRAANEVRSFQTLDGQTYESQVCVITKRNALRYWGDLYTEVLRKSRRTTRTWPPPTS